PRFSLLFIGDAAATQTQSARCSSKIRVSVSSSSETPLQLPKSSTGQVTGTGLQSLLHRRRRYNRRVNRRVSSSSLKSFSLLFIGDAAATWIDFRPSDNNLYAFQSPLHRRRRCNRNYTHNKPQFRPTLTD